MTTSSTPAEGAWEGFQQKNSRWECSSMIWMKKKERQKCTRGSWGESALRKQKWSSCDDRDAWSPGNSWKRSCVWQRCLNPFTQDTKSYHRGLIKTKQKAEEMNLTPSRISESIKLFWGIMAGWDWREDSGGSQLRHLILQIRKLRPSVGGCQI